MSAERHPQPQLWQSDLLASLPGVAHGVTRRVSGMGRADGNVGFSPPRDRVDAWEMRQQWCEVAGLTADRLVTLGQIHGSEVHAVAARHSGWGARPGSQQLGFGDALVTDVPGPILFTLHADCQPILFASPATRRRGPVVAAAHAGWRGTVAGVAAQTLAVMRDEFGVRPADVHVVLGPAIGPCCYEVGEDVAEKWRHVAGSESTRALEPRSDRYRLDLSEANLLLLQRAGVRLEHIEAAAICTRCGGDHWFSHRGQGAHTGRFGAMIALTSRDRGVTA